jgi:hypothetical protein
VIATFPTNIEMVLDVVAENAANTQRSNHAGKNTPPLQRTRAQKSFAISSADAPQSSGAKGLLQRFSCQLHPETSLKEPSKPKKSATLHAVKFNRIGSTMMVEQRRNDD